MPMSALRCLLWLTAVALLAGGIASLSHVPDTLVARAETVAADDVEVLQEMPATGNDWRAARSANSPDIAVDPTNRDVVALANRLDKPDFSCALQMSGDGGRLWAPVNPVPELPAEADKCYGPEVEFDADGTMYYLFVGLEGAGNRPSGVYLTTSDDRGRTFSEPRQVLGRGNYQVRLALDRTSGNPGRLHLVWLRTTEEPGLGGLPAPPNPIVASHSDDGGQTWSDPILVSDPDQQLRAVAPAVAVGEGGALHVAFYDLQDDSRDYRGLEGDTWPGTWSVVHRVSHDRGESFSPSVVVDDELRPPGRVMLIFTMPPPALATDEDGNVYVAWHDARNGDWDVFAAASSDAGRSWSGPVRVNDDAERNGRHQLLPQVAVAPGGRVDVVFFDRREDENNVHQHVYYASSTDRGASYGANVRLTRFSYNSKNGAKYAVPSAQGLYDLGTRLGLAADDTRTLAAWPDGRHPMPGTGVLDVLTTAVLHEPAVVAPAGGALPAWLGVLAAAVVVGGGWLAWRRVRRGRLGGSSEHFPGDREEKDRQSSSVRAW